MKDTLNSVFRNEMVSYLTARRESVSNCEYTHSSQVIHMFDDYLVNTGHSERVIHEDTVISWISTLKGKRRTVRNKVVILHTFISFLQGCGIDVQFTKMPRLYDDYLPYNFTDDEIERIIHSADKLRTANSKLYPMAQVEIPMILRIMFGTGLRLGETLHLKMNDYDVKSGVLTIKMAKNKKQRYVPMCTELSHILHKYIIAMNLMEDSEDYLFPAADRSRCISTDAVQRIFNRILKQNGIESPDRKENERGPCLHCLRHAFVFRSFLKLEKEGICIDDAIPYLSIYLGHESLRETEKYLKFSSEMCPDDVQLFELMASELIPEVLFDA